MKKLLFCSTLFAGLLLTACEPTTEPTTEPEAVSETQAIETQAIDSQAADTATAQAENQMMNEQPTAIPAPDDVAAPPADATMLPSGMAYKVLQPGSGTTHPKLTDTVVVHYTGWTTDGEMFDSSVVRGEPAAFPLNQLIEGWQQSIPLMVAGEKTRFWIPGELAYANSNRPGAPKGMLVFDVELIAIK